MICLNTSVAQFLTYEFWNDRADIIMIIIAALALILTLKQLSSGRKESRRATAYSAYQEYLQSCFEHPKLAYGNQNDIVIDGKTIQEYPWFFSKMLFTFEQILETDQSDEQWTASLKSQLERHAWYLKKSDAVSRDEWSNELRLMIDDVIAESSIDL